MHFDDQRRIHWSPIEFFELATTEPRRLVNHYLLRATPRAFEFEGYCNFLEDVAQNFNVPPQNVALRGSCLIGFSIRPHNDKLWQSYGESSDLDLAIVDAELYDSTEQRVGNWERLNRAGEVQGKASEWFVDRQRDRFYHCCRLHNLPSHLAGSYRDVVKSIADRRHAGTWREVKVFLYRDWWALRARYEFDFGELQKGVASGKLNKPGETPLSRMRRS